MSAPGAHSDSGRAGLTARPPRALRNVMLAGAALGALFVAAPPARAVDGRPSGGAGAVFTLSNDSAGNAVVVFRRAADGTLTAAGSIPTGGLGSGAELGSQGALALGDGGRLLFAVNPGSDTVTVFRLRNGWLVPVDTAPSGGSTPVSLTASHDLLYVLNAGGAGSISGFRITPGGTLDPIAGSTQPLSGSGVGPAEVSFDGDGDILVVTEKTTNTIDTYLVDDNGVAGAPAPQPSAGTTPYGFAFGRGNLLLVSEAFGGAPHASAVSSYRLGEDGTLQVISPSVPTHQTAACWLAATDNGRFAYATNTGSASASGYRVDGHTGSIALLDPSGVTGMTGTTPIDVALSRDSRFLYTLNFADGSISEFRVGGDGSLTALGTVSGLPASVGGLAAR
jgi:6-phosphogluconolactonase